MNNTMAERIRLIIDTDEETRLAIRMATTAANLSVSELVNRILREALATEIQDVKRYFARKRKGPAAE